MIAVKMLCAGSRKRVRVYATGLLLLITGMPAFAQQHVHDAPAAAASTGVAQTYMQDMDHDAMPTTHHDGTSSQAPPVGSLPSSDGAAPKSYPAYGVTLHMPNDPWLSKFMLDNLEQAHGADGNAQAWELKAWTGRNLDRLWLRSEGTRGNEGIEEGDAEVLWGHAISPYWDLMLGARHDLGPGPERDWAAFGIQGLAPYQFDFEGTLYLGPSGRSALRLRASQEWLFTQRLILEPELAFNVYGKSDPRREHAAGLADTELSLRLRYEFSRKFAPYVGYAWTHKWAGTARMAQRAGTPVTDHEWLLGVRVWF